MKLMEMNAKKRGVLLFFLCLVMQLACQADVFKGKIVNAETGEVLVGASVEGKIVTPQSWTFTNTAETDSMGVFKLEAPYEGRMVLTFSMIGYKNQRKVDYAYGPEVKDTTDMEVIKLAPTALMLKEVEVKASLPRFTMRGDTIVFNPEAFKLKEGTRLEELIKKLPGVYQEEGKLYWNSKPIRLTMNGKDIFGGDAILGKLPAEAAQKLKLYDRKSELARHTGQDDGTEDHVLDIQVKPGFLDKWYGELEGAYVTRDRYEASVEANKLSEHDPQMVYVQANNANNYYDRTFNMSYNLNIDGDGKSQYGSYNYQHNWKTKGTDDYDTNSVNASANFGHSDGFGREESTTETFFPNEERTLSLKRNDKHSHKLVPQLESRLFAYTDSVNTITVSVKGTLEKKRDTYENDAASYSYDPGKFAYYSLDEALAAQKGDALYSRLVTRNRNYTSAELEDRNVFLQYEWEHFLGKKGSYKLGGYTYLQGTENQQLIDRKLEYLREGYMETLWQSYDNPARHFQEMLSASLDYWLGKKVFVTLADKATYIRYHERRHVYADTDENLTADGRPTTQDKANGMDYLSHSWNNELSLNSTITPVKALMIMPKFTWKMIRDKADFNYGDLDTAAVRVSHLFLPSVRMKWKLSRERNMDLSFAYNTTVSGMMKTLGYRDTMDPLYVTLGNPLLGKSHSHTTSYNYHRLWLRQQVNLALSASYTKDINPLGYVYRYMPTLGAYEMMPMNVKGGELLKVGFSYDQGLGVYFRVANQFNVTSSRSYGYMTVIDESNRSLVDLLGDANTLQLNKQRLFNLYDRVDLSYESEKLKVTIYDRLQWYRYRYTDTSYNSNPFYNQLGLDLEWDVKPLEFHVYLTDHFRSGYQTAEMNGHKPIAAAEIEYRFFKDKCCLSLSADDIFNKDIFYSTKTMAYQRTETSNEYFHHYLRIGFSYKFDAKVKK